jgi:hypothetical protein
MPPNVCVVLQLGNNRILFKKQPGVNLAQVLRQARAV